MGYVKLNDGEAPTRTAVFRALPVWLLAAVMATYAVVGVSVANHPPEQAIGHATTAFRLADRLATAQVSVRTPGAPERSCTWRAGDGVFSCADDAYAFVGPYAGYAAGRPGRCTWLHPLPGGATTVVRWPDVALGDRVEARLALLEGVGPGAEVRLQVQAAGHPVGTARTSESSEVGYFSEAVAPGPARGELRLELSAADHAWRLACVEVLMTGIRRTGPAAPDRLEPERSLAPIAVPRPGGRR